MIAETTKKSALRLAALLMAAVLWLTACASAGKETTVSQLQLGQKYLSEMNYSEAIAAFTEAIRLDPNDIQAYFGRAQAYEALGKHDEAKEDYTAVIEKAEDMPYLQAQAYAGRAEINETLAETVSAELDYNKAIALLEQDDAGKKEEIDSETVKALLIRTLYRHAAVCIGLELRDKALADYDRLEQLGEDVTNARDELNDIPADAGADAETPADTETESSSGTQETGEEPASREESAATEAQTDPGKKEPAASSTSVSSSTSSSSKAEEKPVSSVSQAPAVEPETSYSTTNSGMDDGYTDGTLSYTEKTTVTYQVGGKKLSVKYDYNSKFVFSDGTPDDGPVGEERVGYTRTGYITRRDAYTLSGPVQSVERVGDDHVIIYVPAGTTISVSESGDTNLEETAAYDELWLCTLDGISTDEQRKAECKKDTSPRDDSRLTNHGASVTLQKNQMCKVFAYNVWSLYRGLGGITFCAV